MTHDAINSNYTPFLLDASLLRSTSFSFDSLLSDAVTSGQVSLSDTGGTGLDVGFFCLGWAGGSFDDGEGDTVTEAGGGAAVDAEARAAICSCRTLQKLTAGGFADSIDKARGREIDVSVVAVVVVVVDEESVGPTPLFSAIPLFPRQFLYSSFSIIFSQASR